MGVVGAQPLLWWFADQIPFRAQNSHRPFVPIAALIVNLMAQPSLVTEANTLVTAHPALVEIVHAQVNFFEARHLKGVRQQRLNSIRAVAESPEVTVGQP